MCYNPTLRPLTPVQVRIREQQEELTKIGDFLFKRNSEYQKQFTALKKRISAETKKYLEVYEKNPDDRALSDFNINMDKNVIEIVGFEMFLKQECG